MSKEIEMNFNSISQLAKEIHQRNTDKSFCSRPINVGELLMLVVSELGEALEADRDNKYSKVSDKDKKMLSNLKDSDFVERFNAQIKDTFEDEIADAVIRLLGMSERLEIDIEWHVLQKMKYNKFRPNGGKAY